MSSITFSEFGRILSELNSDFRLFPSRSKRSSMIYLRGGYHPDSGKYDLNEVLAFPSPHHWSFPKYDFIDSGGLIGRGYTTVFKMLVRRKLIDKDRLRALLPQALDPVLAKPARPKEKDDDAPQIPVHAAPTRSTKLRITRRAPG